MRSRPFFSVLLFIFIILYPLAGLAQTEVRVTGVRLNQTSLIMAAGSTEIISAVVSPDNATNKEIGWFTSDPQVIQVTDLGDIPGLTHSAEIRALSAGTATVTVVTEDGGRRAQCQVEVLVPVRSISLNLAEVTLSPNQEMWLQARVQPRDATNPQLIWGSSNPAVASVSENGLVKARKTGETRIVIRSVEDEMITAYCNVTVSETAAPAVPTETETEPPKEPEPVPEPEPEPEPVLQTEQAEEIQTGVMDNLPLVGLGAGALIVIVLAIFIISRGQGTKKAVVVPPAEVRQFKSKPFIMGKSGQFAGQRFDLVGGRLVMGRDSSTAQLVYPLSREEISRKHCTVMYDEGTRKFILEDSSSNGTYLSSGERLNPGQRYHLNSGESFYLAEPGELFEAKVE